MRFSFLQKIMKWFGKKDFPCQSDHPQCRKKFLQYVDGESGKEEKEKFEQHIQQCPICSEKYTLEHTIKKSLQSKIQQKEAPSDLVQNIKNKIE